MKKNSLIPLFFLFFFIKNTFAQLRLARIFSNHAVLQQQKPIPIWGWSKPYDTIQIDLATQSKTIKADGDGKFQVIFEAMPAGGPFELNVKNKYNSLKISDLYIGEVWLISGQSNMEWRVLESDNFLEEKKNANFPLIRHFKIEHDISLNPEDDLKTGDWKLASEKNVGEFSAIGFFTARVLHQRLNVPIGIVNSSWGGSQIESWISKDAMLESEEFRAYAEKMPKNWQEADDLLDKNLRYNLLPHEKQFSTLIDEAFYSEKNYDFSYWLQESPIGQWDWKGIWAFRGKGFMAKKVIIPDSMIAVSTILGLGYNDSENEIYINGDLISFGTIKENRKINIKPNTWKNGENTIFIKMGEMKNPNWFGMGIMGDENNLFIESNQEKISLTGMWHFMPSFADKHYYTHSSNNLGTIVFNAMIAPIIPFALRGMAWYQGESNTSRAVQYRKAFPLMIQDWRKKWNETLPFHFIQLANCGENQSSNQGSDWAELREAQTQALQLPNTYMTVNYDLGNPNDIHPTNKQEFAKRLTNNILHHQYVQNTPFQYPLFEKINIENEKAILTFFCQKNTLKTKNGEVAKGFEVASDDKFFYKVNATIEGNTIIVFHPKNQKIASVRYAWADSPNDANIYSSEDLPLCPFRTDNWEEKTKAKKF